MKVFIDTNLFLRYLLDDIPEQADAVEEILKEAYEGEPELWTNPMVIADSIFEEIPREFLVDNIDLI